MWMTVRQRRSREVQFNVYNLTPMKKAARRQPRLDMGGSLTPRSDFAYFLPAGCEVCKAPPRTWMKSDLVFLPYWPRFRRRGQIFRFWPVSGPEAGCWIWILVRDYQIT
jgi:hypothetical protein